MATPTPTVTGLNTVVDIINAGKKIEHYKLGKHRKFSILFWVFLTKTQAHCPIVLA